MLEMKKSNTEFEHFDKGMDVLLKVSHDDLKAALDAEKKAKEAKRTRKPRKRQDDKRD